MKLKFGDPESIRVARSYEDKLEFEHIKQALKGKVRCPFCKVIKKEIVDYSIKNKWVQWEGCNTPGCKDNISSHNFRNDWDGTTDLEGKILW